MVGRDDVFSKKDPPATIEVTKQIVDEISDNVLRNIQPIDNRTIQELIDDDFIPIDDRTQQELEDDDYASLESENESDSDDKVTLESDNESESEIVDTIPPAPGETSWSSNKIADIVPPAPEEIGDFVLPAPKEIIDIVPPTPEEMDTTLAWDTQKTEITTPGPIIKLSTDYNKKVRAAKNIKDKYQRKAIGQKNSNNKILIQKTRTKSIIYLDHLKETNKIAGDAVHFIRTQIDSTDF